MRVRRRAVSAASAPLGSRFRPVLVWGRSVRDRTQSRAFVAASCCGGVIPVSSSFRQATACGQRRFLADVLAVAKHLRRLRLYRCRVKTESRGHALKISSRMVVEGKTREPAMSCRSRFFGAVSNLHQTLSASVTAPVAGWGEVRRGLDPDLGARSAGP